MKYTFNFLLALLISGNCFTLNFQLLQPEPVFDKNKTAGKKDPGEKKTIKSAMAKEKGNNNPKTKKDTTAENTEFYGPLSWKPALLY